MAEPHLLVMSTPVQDALSDRDLLTRYQDGDQDAFTGLVDRHAPLVLASCRRQLGTADADDAVQTVFLTLARKPQQATKAPSIAAWLLRVARNVCANAIRTRRSRYRIERAVGLESTHEGSEAGTHLAVTQVDDLLDRLPEIERTVVVLHVLEDVPHDEIAHRLGCPVGTVRSHLSRGLARLRDRLRRRGIPTAAVALLALLAGEARASVSHSLHEACRHAVLPRSARPAARRLRPWAALVLCAFLLLPLAAVMNRWRAGEPAMLRHEASSTAPATSVVGTVVAVNDIDERPGPLMRLITYNLEDPDEEKGWRVVRTRILSWPSNLLATPKFEHLGGWLPVDVRNAIADRVSVLDLLDLGKERSEVPEDLCLCVGGGIDDGRTWIAMLPLRSVSDLVFTGKQLGFWIGQDWDPKRLLADKTDPLVVALRAVLAARGLEHSADDPCAEWTLHGLAHENPAISALWSAVHRRQVSEDERRLYARCSSNSFAIPLILEPPMAADPAEPRAVH
jgi:RNA polymerase sigma factor (sigma-70 family)